MYLPNTPTKQLVLSGFACCYLFLPINGLAEEIRLLPLVVKGDYPTDEEAQSSQSGTTELDQKTLQTLPKGNGSITEALKILPEVELSDTSQHSNQAGEIKPGKASILGAPHYQNNFIVDGSPNNSLLDPGSDTSDEGQLEGHSQEMFLQLQLIDSIEVHTSNVPAAYGQFSGGVISAKTKRPEFEWKGGIGMRYTSDALTTFHVEDETDFELSNDAADDQPKFEKINYNAFLNVPVNENNAFYVSYDRLSSDIPVLHLGRTEHENRELDNLLTKWTHFFSDDHIMDISFSTAPYSETRWLSNVEDSEYQIKGGGYKLNAEFEDLLSSGKLNTNLSFNESIKSRSAPQNYYYWAQTDTFPWGRIYDGLYSRQGGKGDLESQQSRKYLKSQYELNKIQLKDSQHSISLTGELQHISAHKTRNEEANKYVAGESNNEPESGIANLICNGADACIDGEQYAVNRTTYLKGTREAAIVSTGLSLEDAIEYKQLMLRLGLRYDYNDFMDNHDLAYRSFGKFDLFADKKWFITAGLNRYYAQSFLSHKLRQAGKSYQEYTRGLVGGYDEFGQKIVTPDEWSLGDDYNRNITEYSRLKTPYTDERTIGLETKLFGGTLAMEQIYRDGYNQFTSETSAVQDDGYTYTTLTNNGWSTFETFKIKWDKSWGKHHLMLSYFNGKGSKNYLDNYDDEADDIDNTAIYYKGKLYQLSDFGRIETPTPPTIKLYYGYHQDVGFNLGFFANLKGAYKSFESDSYVIEYVQTGEDVDATREVPLYKYVHYDPFYTADLNLSYKHKWLDNIFSVSLVVNNLFNKVEKVSDSTNNYTLGRQFWLGFNYDF